MEAIRVNYARVIKRNHMFEDDYPGMVRSTLMYTMCERTFMDKLVNLGVLGKIGMIIEFYSPHGHPWTSCTLMGFWSMSNMTLALIGLQDPKMNSYGCPRYHFTL
jgi:hypothetical protein